jgi:hypothetical protein
MTSPLASYSSATEQRNPLIAGYLPIETRKYTLASGTLALGAIVGLVLNATPVGAAVAGNTGNGTIGTLSLGTNARAGVYRAVCIEPAANGGTFAIEDPDGVVYGRVNVGTPAAGAVIFTIADGATDFVAGDAFTITVVATGAVLRCAAAATDGSSRPHGIVAMAADATAAATEVLVYERGEFDESQLSIGAGLTVAGARDVLRARGVHLIPVGNA